MYKIDPISDRPFVEEFRRNPIGGHSPGLTRVLSILRVDPTGHQVIIVCRKPFAKWTLATMPPRRQDPIRFEDEAAFATREEAEWEVFRRRWRAATGESLDDTLQA
jgi:branched-chain amino acid transport system permease protein